MIFIGCLILMTGLGESRGWTLPYDFVRSALDYFRSPSAIFLLDEELSSTRDTLNFLKLQVLLSSNDFHFSSVSTPSAVSKALESRFQNGKETVVVPRTGENRIRFLEKLSNETDISSYKWLFASRETSKTLEKLRIPLTTEFVFARRDDDGYDLSEVYDIRSERKSRRFLGRWVPGGQFPDGATLGDLFSRRKDLQGAPIQVLSSRKEPCDKLSFSVGVAPVVECIHKILWDMMAEMLNATTELVLVRKMNRNTILTAGAELNLRSATLDPLNLPTRSYVWPVFRTRVEVAVRYQQQEVEWKTFLQPFSLGMWMVIVFWMVLCDLVMAAVDFASGWSQKSFLESYGELSFTAAFVFCNQGKYLGARIMFLMMLIVPGVLFPGYSASLTSFLTVSLYRMPFRNLEELSRMEEYKLGWHRSFPRENMFNLNDLSPVERALMQNNVLPREEMPATDDEGIEKMCTEKFVYLTILNTLLALKPKCKYFTLKEHFRTLFTSMEMRKGSWYHPFLDRCERTLDFAGIIRKTKFDLALKHFRRDSQQTIPETNAIRLENIVLSFAALLAGVASSGALLGAEIVFSRSKKGWKTGPSERA